jgi:hypothetical protein
VRPGTKARHDAVRGPGWGATIFVALGLAAAASPTASADPAAEPARFNLGLELPLLTVLRFEAEEQLSRGGSVEHSDVTVGPLLYEDDNGAQVPLMVAFAVRFHGDFRAGLRAGVGILCFDGPSSGEQGKDLNWQAEPFAGYTFMADSRLAPYVAAGPLVAHSCTGTTSDQRRSTLFGLHAGPGVRYALVESLFAYSELRVRSSWGKHTFLSHGETPRDFDAFDLRAQWILGFVGAF